MDKYTELEKQAQKFLDETDTMQFSTVELLTMFYKHKEQLRIGGVMPRFLFRYKFLDENFKVEIEAENLNKAMFNFATYYHQIQEIYSVVRVS